MNDGLSVLLWLIVLVGVACAFVFACEAWADFKRAQDDLPDAGIDDTAEFPAVSDEAA